MLELRGQRMGTRHILRRGRDRSLRHRRPGGSTRRWRRTLPAQDDRRLLVDLAAAGKAVAHAVDEPGPRLGAGGRLRVTARLGSSWAAAGGASRLLGLELLALVTTREV